MPNHVVKQGECLSSIAAKHGFASWKTIYDAPENSQFRHDRPDPNLIYPGDNVFIPDKGGKKDDAPVDNKHKYKKHSTKTYLRIFMKDFTGDPLVGLRYRLKVGAQVTDGTLGDDGKLEEPISPTATDANLTLWVEEEPVERRYNWALKIGALDPVETVRGVQARLNNLAHDSGKVDGIIGPITKGATIEFQQKYELDDDGIAGPITKGKLKEIYGC